MTPKTKQEVPDKLEEKESPMSVDTEFKVTSEVNKNANSNVLKEKITIPAMDKSSDAQANGKS
jgi:hypothetical protein